MPITGGTRRIKDLATDEKVIIHYTNSTQDGRNSENYEKLFEAIAAGCLQIITPAIEGINKSLLDISASLQTKYKREEPSVYYRDKVKSLQLEIELLKLKLRESEASKPA